jgi:tRNA threonylcarbamoyladenosine biosynthesis protein TsaE
MQRIFKNENELQAFATQLATVIPQRFYLYLSGELGAGKTTLTRQLLRQLGVTELIKSPTYTLVETYTTTLALIHHFDLYRLQTIRELEDLALEDYFTEKAIVIVEWPEKGLGGLPIADIVCTLYYHEQGRRIDCTAYSQSGQSVLTAMEKQ